MSELPCFRCGSIVYREVELHGETLYRCDGCGRIYDLGEYLREKRLREQRTPDNKKLYKGLDRLRKIYEMGARCEKCGFSDLRALELHHTSEREYLLLCANCHSILHADQRSNTPQLLNTLST